MPRYRLSQRVNWASYNKFLADIKQAGIDPALLPPLFPRYHMTARRDWLALHFPMLFMCPRCRKVGLPDEMKDPIRTMCLACGSSLGLRYPGQYDEEEETVEQQALHAQQAADRQVQLKQQQDKIMAGLAVTQRKRTHTASDILSAASRRPALPDNGTNDVQHGSPLDVSKTEEPTGAQPAHEEKDE